MSKMVPGQRTGCVQCPLSLPPASRCPQWPVRWCPAAGTARRPQHPLWPLLPVALLQAAQGTERASRCWHMRQGAAASCIMRGVYHCQVFFMWQVSPRSDMPRKIIAAVTSGSGSCVPSDICRVASTACSSRLWSTARPASLPPWSPVTRQHAGQPSLINPAWKASCALHLGAITGNVEEPHLALSDAAAAQSGRAAAAHLCAPVRLPAARSAPAAGSRPGCAGWVADGVCKRTICQKTPSFVVWCKRA